LQNFFDLRFFAARTSRNDWFSAFCTRRNKWKQPPRRKKQRAQKTKRIKKNSSWSSRLAAVLPYSIWIKL